MRDKPFLISASDIHTWHGEEEIAQFKIFGDHRKQNSTSEIENLFDGKETTMWTSNIGASTSDTFIQIMFKAEFYFYFLKY